MILSSPGSPKPTKVGFRVWAGMAKSEKMCRRKQHGGQRLGQILSQILRKMQPSHIEFGPADTFSELLTARNSTYISHSTWDNLFHQNWERMAGDIRQDYKEDGRRLEN